MTTMESWRESRDRYLAGLQEQADQEREANPQYKLQGSIAMWVGGVCSSNERAGVEVKMTGLITQLVQGIEFMSEIAEDGLQGRPSRFALAVAQTRIAHLRGLLRRLFDGTLPVE